MALRSEFALHHSGLEPFLFASVWEETNGCSLSILSALARLGVDPWGEAAKLAAMPRAKAASTLAGILARLPTSGTEIPSYPTLARDLVELLPKTVATPTAPTTPALLGLDLGKMKLGIIVALSFLLFLLQGQGWLF